tara:strand:- start:528 stop:1400 length:873 start_codon:yes stop_codon:yes gene_type:complete
MKNSIVVLTRGYADIKKYNKLLKRNRYIEKNLEDKSIDIIIFHEGNIIYKHQKYIIDNSKNLNIKFINVKNEFKKKEIDFYEPTKKFSLGYRNMCSFWFIGFWKYVSDYNKILRIDEDCYIKSSIENIFSKCDNKVCLFGHYTNDSKYVTKGLNDFTISFLKNKNILKKKSKPSGPYTNIICFNLDLLKQNKLLFDYINEIKKSNNIYIYRWGDLPLWGEVLKYMYEDNDYEHIREIKYYHESHKLEINSNVNTNIKESFSNIKLKKNNNIILYILIIALIILFCIKNRS